MGVVALKDKSFWVLVSVTYCEISTGCSTNEFLYFIFDPRIPAAFWKTAIVYMLLFRSSYYNFADYLHLFPQCPLLKIWFSINVYLMSLCPWFNMPPMSFPAMALGRQGKFPFASNVKFLQVRVICCTETFANRFFCFSFIGLLINI